MFILVSTVNGIACATHMSGRDCTFETDKACPNAFLYYRKGKPETLSRQLFVAVNVIASLGTTAISMNPPLSEKDYLTASELAARTGMSTTTIWRLKRDEKIPFYQPGGKNSLVRFPPNALELANSQSTTTESNEGDSTNSNKSEKPLPGPRPDWMNKTTF